MATNTETAVEKVTPRYVILPNLPLDVYETPDPDTHALIAECPSETQAKLVLNALNQSAAVDTMEKVVRRCEIDFDVLITRGDIADEPRAHETLRIIRAALAQLESFKNK